jgi:putative DNA primase/helicase
VGAHGIYINAVGPLTLYAGEEKPQIWSALGEILVPVCDIDGLLLAAQSIAADGRKSITRGASMVGGHHLIGEIAPGGRLLIAEGYATAATLHEATGLPVAVAFFAGNLGPVAQAYHERHPELRIIIAGDNDHMKERELGADGQPKENVGKVKAEAAALRCGGAALLPPFKPDQDGSDWNDLAKLLGAEFKKVLHETFAAAERRISASAARREPEANRKVSLHAGRVAASR